MTEKIAKTASGPSARTFEPGPNQMGQITVTAIRIEDQKLRYQPEDDGIIELAQDIAQKGLLQPVGVRLREDGNYQLLWGGRRLAAHRRLGKARIWAHVYGDNEIPVKALALVENLQRVNLSLVEEVEAVNYLHTEEKKSPDQISSLLSKGRSWVLRRLAIPNLPEELRGRVLDGTIAVGVAEEIARLSHAGFRRFLASQAEVLRWTINQAKAATDTYIQSIESGGAAPTAEESGREPAAGPTIMLGCAQCGQLRPEEDLALVRVCLMGCDPAPSGSVEDGEAKKGEV